MNNRLPFGPIVLAVLLLLAVPAAYATDAETVAKASGPDAYTIQEIQAKAAQLDGKPVAVRGRVTKVSKAIMRRNWIHLRDGSGPSDGRDLVVTSADAPSVGEVVTARGTLAKDRDFGSGYKYSVIVENARVR